MKKSFVLSVLILFLLISFVSASWLEDFFKEITGNTVMLTKCIDTDNGKNYEEFGIVTYKKWFRQRIKKDYCEESVLIEYYCNEKEKAKRDINFCENGCNDGACTKETESLEDNLTSKNITIIGGSESNRTLNEKCVELIEGHNNLYEKRINVIFVAINRNISTLINHAIAIVDYYGENMGLMAIEPFKSNRNKFNFYYINETGVVGEDETNPEVDRLLSYCNLNNIQGIAFTNFRLGEVAGLGGPGRAKISYFEFPQPNIVVHEFGHSFGLLWDEREGPGIFTLQVNSTQHGNCYYSSYVNCTVIKECSSSGKCREINVCHETEESLNDCKTNARWKDLIGSGQEDNKIDCYLGCGDKKNEYRSTFSNVMMWTTSHFSFGPFNERILCGRIQKLTGSAEGICEDLCGKDCIDYDFAIPAIPAITRNT